METPVRWSEIVSELDPEHQDLLFGTSLTIFETSSLAFSSGKHRYVLWILDRFSAHLPYILRFDNLNESFSNWLLFSSLFMVACLVLVLLIDSRKFDKADADDAYESPVSNAILRIALLGLDFSNVIDVPSGICSFSCFLVPYVHLSWAPRWRLLCMLEGVNPFDGMKVFLNLRKILLMIWPERIWNFWRLLTHLNLSRIRLVLPWGQLIRGVEELHRDHLVIDRMTFVCGS